MRLPLRFGGLDPHSSDDPLSALFAPAIADPLYFMDEEGRPYPALARALPEPHASGARVGLRPELVSARGRRLTGLDLAFSLARARAGGGASDLTSFGTPTVDPKDRLAVIVAGAEPHVLARVLASPFTALVPRGFSPLAPDGCGAFGATLERSRVTLARNERAARGAAFLDRIEISAATDLADSLRAFEAGLVDIGWLGNGLYRARPGSLALTGPSYGWLVLRTGRDARSWGAPGMADQLCAAVPSDVLRRFGVYALPRADPGMRWGGGATELWVSADAADQIELCRALEPLLRSRGNEVHTRVAPRAEWLSARRSGRFGLMLDFVRGKMGNLREMQNALLAAVDPALSRRPLRAIASITEVTRTLPLGVLGELRISGSRMPEFEELSAWQLGAVWSNHEKK